MIDVKEIILTDDPLKNIFIMAPHLSEADQNKVFGMVCGLIGSSECKKDDKQRDESESLEGGR